jgi:hypothetical protein
MATKTLTKSTRKGLVAKLDVTLTGDVVDHALAFCCTWDQGPQTGAFVAPVWARTRTATLRGVADAIREHGVRFFTRSTWREALTNDEARACLALARKLRMKFFPELDGE